MTDGTGAAESLMEARRVYSEQATLVQGPAYAASQQLFFEQRRVAKRGPPTPAFSSTGLATPTGDTFGPTAPTASGSTPPAKQDTGLFQPMHYQQETAFVATAHSAGVNANNPTDMALWMKETISTRAQVLDTIRHYHTAVIRPELYNLINQVEAALVSLDDRLLRQSKELAWMASENRALQKQSAALMVILTGWDTSMSPSERLFMVNWMLEQITHVQAFLQQRGWANFDGEYKYLNVLSADPSTPPAGAQKWSSVTLLSFKSWDLRKAFMEAYGGTQGTPLYKDARTPVPRHLLQALNLKEETEPRQVVILWKTLTVMSPQMARGFDEQATACARLHYYAEGEQFKGILEITKVISDWLATTPPDELMTEEDTIWSYSWNKIVFGVQQEMDAAERDHFANAKAAAKGTGKGMLAGKGSRHWTAPMIYSASSMPYPIDLEIRLVSQVAYVWDEYCDKFGENSRKCGDYRQATFSGAPVAATPLLTVWVPALDAFDGSFSAVGAGNNRELYLRFLSTSEAKDVLTYKQSNLLHWTVWSPDPNGYLRFNNAKQFIAQDLLVTIIF
ncbi:unnamed protein product [Symbiodinium natans]|uniref:Uncharacterized protein n=1 Tax=Symbiodinium natans TaxID=878477 RepID=A0A812LFH6_9DINO|nr:unnamed protein product [Symbiodinium natans]